MVGSEESTSGGSIWYRVSEVPLIAEDRQLLPWNLFFERLRRLNKAQQLLCVVITLYTVFDRSEEGHEWSANMPWVRLVVIASTLAEVNMWLGHTWMW